MKARNDVLHAPASRRVRNPGKLLFGEALLLDHWKKHKL
jgi:hypothetical protein